MLVPTSAARYSTMLTKGLSSVAFMLVWALSGHASAELIVDSGSAQVAKPPSAVMISQNVRVRPAASATRPSTNNNSAYTAATDDLNEEVVRYVFGSPQASSDRMQGLIEQKQREFAVTQQAQLTIEENQRVRPKGASPSYDYRQGNLIASFDFNSWLNADPFRKSQAVRYQQFLAARVGYNNVPPLQQLLTTARSWEDCGYEPYQLPPEYLWQNMVPTLQLYAALKAQGILPASTEIRSVYRSPLLNRCAGGAEGSKHMSNGAMDIWVPEYSNNSWSNQQLQNNLCDFWLYQGQAYNFGLGLYGTGAIHIDTQGYRKWGGNHSSSSSPCRY